MVGDSHGVKEGGVVEHHLWTLHVECFPQDVPSAIEADISALGINESLHVSDLAVPARSRSSPLSRRRSCRSSRRRSSRSRR